MRRTVEIVLLSILLACFVLSGCSDKPSEREILNDVIEYVEANSGKDQTVRLTNWSYGSSNGMGLSIVHLDYSGSYDLLQLDKIRVAINNYMVENPDSFLNSCAICITLSYIDYPYDTWKNSK